MGSGVSREEAEAHLRRQEALIQRLQTIVAEKSGATRDSLTTANDFTLLHSSRPPAPFPSTELYDEVHILADRARASEKFQIEPVVSEYEKEMPNATWSPPTEDEAALYRDVRPWLAVMAPSTRFQYNATDAKPKFKLQLEHVYGYRTVGMRHNLIVPSEDPDSVVYAVGGVAVVHNVRTHAQTFFREHVGTITSIAYNPSTDIVATADQGRFPSIILWSRKTCQLVSKFTGQLRRGISAVAFSRQGQFVAGLGLDEDHSIAVYDARHGRMIGSCSIHGSASSNGSSPVSKHPPIETSYVASLVANHEEDTCTTHPFLTIGQNMVRWWALKTDTSSTRDCLVPQDAILGSLGDLQTFTCAASSVNFTAVGTQSGEIYLFRSFKLHRVVTGHQGSVTSLSLTMNGQSLLSGGVDGFVSLWDPTLDFKRSLSVAVPSCLTSAKITKVKSNPVRGVALRVNKTSGQVEELMVGTLAGSVLSMHPITGVVQPDRSFESHGCDLTKHGASLFTAELTGLCTHPTRPLFASVSECVLCLWDTESKMMIARRFLSFRAQCVMWSPCGTYLVAGLHNGVLVVFTLDALMDQNRDKRSELRVSNRRVQCLRFSPDGSLLAIGSADNNVLLYDVSAGANTESWTVGSRLVGPRGVILSIDFSTDAKFLQCATQAYEVVYFDLHRLEMVSPFVARQMAEAGWYTFSSILGWNVQGIWPHGSQLDDVNAVARSPSGTLLATAEESGVIKVFQFPCVGGGLDKEGLLTKRPDSERGIGHSRRAAQVQWLGSDRLISAGAEDLACFEWRVVPES